MNIKIQKKIQIALTLAAIPYLLLPISAPAIEPSASALASSSSANGDYALEIDPNEHGVERKEIQNLLDTIETQWNNHNLDALMSHYADDYVNNDGLDRKAVSDLTKDFWEQYPDAKSSSKVKEVRIDGSYATVDSRDTATGTTAKEIPGINSKGDLRSVSEGRLYLRRFANGWKIIGDRIDYEKVKVGYGLGRQLDSEFTAPEQVKAGRKYSAKLEVKLPTGLAAVGEITSQYLQFPSAQSIFPNSPQTEIWKPLDSNAIQKDSFVLERIMEANTSNHNELLMTTVGITNAARNSLVGLEFLTRRMNVVPATEEGPEVAQTTETKNKDIKTADSKNNETKDAETKSSETKNTEKTKSTKNNHR